MEYPFTPLQQQALDLVMAEPALASFYLAGGTALAAFYLSHRVSDDLDFFTDQLADSAAIEHAVSALKTKLTAEHVEYQRVFDRRLYFFTFTSGEVLKLEFSEYPFPLLEPIQNMDGVRVASKRDIAAGKLMALVERFEPKDFVDLYFLTKELPLKTMQADVAKKFGMTIAPLTLGSELMKVDRIIALPKMIKSLTVDELQHGLHALAKSLSADILKE